MLKLKDFMTLSINDNASLGKLIGGHSGGGSECGDVTADTHSRSSETGSTIADDCDSDQEGCPSMSSGPTNG